MSRLRLARDRLHALLLLLVCLSGAVFELQTISSTLTIYSFAKSYTKDREDIEAFHRHWFGLLLVGPTKFVGSASRCSICCN